MKTGDDPLSLEKLTIMRAFSMKKHRLSRIVYRLLCGLLIVSVLFSCWGCAFSKKKSEAEKYSERLDRCVEQIKAKADFVPDVALVLGSGLGDYVNNLDIVATIPYSEIDGWPTTSVEGHEGNLIFATMNNLNIAVLQGRVHYYEGYEMQEVVLPLRVLHLLGARTVIITNAVGAINESYSVGDFMVVEDHIASLVPSPLVGENLDELGERFTGMSFAYNEALRESVLAVAKEEGITVHSGVFIQTMGPQYETPAEIRAYRIWGADTVGMSSAVEAAAAAHMGMKICMINCVTNMAAGIGDQDPSHDDIHDASSMLSENFAKLITGLLQTIE